MPPKKGSVQAAKAKVVEDKTFGLKNKKGKKQQNFIQMVEKQGKNSGGRDEKEREKERLAQKAAKEAKDREKDMLNDLFKPVTTQKIAAGVDPKSVLCAFFVKGLCKKGDGCKFSHDKNIERKSAKIDVFSDRRGADEGMEDWDQAKLEDAINQKHGAAGAKQNPTTIICKHFLEALEKRQYGWFWACPNGGEACKYRHALPPGYVLKREKKAMDDGKEVISLEDLVERERAALPANRTPVTWDSFQAWKKRKLEEKKRDLAATDSGKRKAIETGAHAGKVSGRELFQFRPDLALQDDEDADDTSYARENADGEDDSKINDLSKIDYSAPSAAPPLPGTAGGAAAAEAAQDAGAPVAAAAAAAAIDEDLFDEGDLDGLDD